MLLSLEILMSIIRTGLPILVELINLVNSDIIFLSQMTSLRWLTFLLGSQTVILIILLFYFLHLILVLVLQWLSLHWKILIMLLSQFPLTFQLIYNEMPHFITQHMTILVLIVMIGLRDHLRNVPWEDIFKFSAYAAASEFFKWVQVGTDVYILHRKYQAIHLLCCCHSSQKSLFSFVPTRKIF